MPAGRSNDVSNGVLDSLASSSQGIGSVSMMLAISEMMRWFIGEKTEFGWPIDRKYSTKALATFFCVVDRLMVDLLPAVASLIVGTMSRYWLLDPICSFAQTRT